jgi:phosphoribosylanthranilate isomerase
VPAPLLKICGLRLESQAAAVAELGVDALGVIAVAGSPRWLEPASRPALFAAMRQANPRCRGVLVVANPSDDDLDSLRPQWGGHDVLQLHGQESPQRCRQLAERLGCPVWKALRLGHAGDLDRVSAYGGVVEAVLLDAWVPDQLGGTGQRIPTEWLVDFQPPMPWWLAGGISASSVASVLRTLSPDGLDASSSVEISPGLKDLGRVSELVSLVKAGERLAPAK